MVKTPEEAHKQWREIWGSGPPVGEIANEVIFENETIRVWHLDVGPGEVSPLHTHTNPYFSIILESAPLKAQFVDGSSSVDEDPVGSVLWYGTDEGKGTHTVENVGDTRCVARVIELLS